MPYDDPNYDDPMAGFDPYGAQPPMVAAAPVAQDEQPITYERDIAPGAGRLFDEIGADQSLTPRERMDMQSKLLQGVGDINRRRDELARVRDDSMIRKMRMERESMSLDAARNQRAQQTAAAERMAGLGAKLQETLKLPPAERAAAIAEIEAQNFDLLGSSYTASQRFESVKRTAMMGAGETLAPPVFKTAKEEMEYLAEYGDSEIGRAAYIAAKQGDITGAGSLMALDRTSREERKTAEQEAKEQVAIRNQMIDDAARLKFTTDADIDNWEADQASKAGVQPRRLWMKPETHEEARRVVFNLGTPEDLREWEEAEDDLRSRDTLRAKIANNVILRAQNERLKMQSKEPVTKSKGLVRLQGE